MKGRANLLLRIKLRSKYAVAVSTVSEFEKSFSRTELHMLSAVYAVNIPRTSAYNQKYVF
jgi:hypothetical protein